MREKPPFAIAVDELVKGIGDPRKAAYLLLEVEELVGVQLLPAHGIPPVSIAYPTSLLTPSVAPSFSLEGQDYIDATSLVGREIPLPAVEDFPIFAFLDATLLVIGGIDFSDTYLLRFANGILEGFTARGWGELLAHWVETQNWGSDFENVPRWDATLLTYYVEDYIKGYACRLESYRSIVQKAQELRNQSTDERGCHRNEMQDSGCKMQGQIES
ncbi:hypothetical protein HYR99_09960 [Candidatus Poribacteria bacterium]|nr:hypothetical protein [Candidatus Poribacteria bacterium]